MENKGVTNMTKVTLLGDSIRLFGYGTKVPEMLDAVRDGLFNKALANREKRTYTCTTLDEINEAIEKNGDGFVRAMWCGEEECEDGVKAATGVGSRCIPFEQENISDKCVCCGKPADKMLYWGKAY